MKIVGILEKCSSFMNVFSYSIVVSLVSWIGRTEKKTQSVSRSDICWLIETFPKKSCFACGELIALLGPRRTWTVFPAVEHELKSLMKRWNRTQVVLGHKLVGLSKGISWSKC